MYDPRIDRLADLLLDHSCRIEKCEKVLVEAIDLPDASLVCAPVQGAAEARGRVADNSCGGEHAFGLSDGRRLGAGYLPPGADAFADWCIIKGVGNCSSHWWGP